MRDLSNAPTILLIDDELSMRELLALILQLRLGAQILQAENGRQGLQVALEQGPDLVVLDVRMPVMDGWETAACLKADPKTASIPILVLSTADRRSDMHRALELGCDKFVVKPCTPAVLVKEVTDLLSCFDRSPVTPELQMSN